MITPSFGLTATERVLPKLALDFTTASLDSRITFTRTTGASNPATYINSSGVVTAATNNQPRFDYDPLTLACKGLLIEESRTNRVKYSSAIATWTTGINFLRTNNYETSPDGTSNATRLVATGAAFSYDLSSAQVSGTTYTLSMWAKRNNAGSQAFGFFRNGTGTVDSPVALTSQWQRFSFTYTASGTSYAGVAAASDADVSVFGFQMEAGAFATSYIPTTTTALTRNADVAVMTGTNFSDWYNAGTGAFNCAVLPKSATGTKPVLQFDDATALNTIAMQGNATAVELKITTLAVLQSTLSTGTITANTAYGSCGAWTAGSNALSKSGGAATTGSPVSIPTVTQSRLGSDGTNYFNGWLQKINYWPQRLTNSEVQAFSK